MAGDKDKEKVFQDWLDRVVQFPLPKNKTARVRFLAKELAEGASEGFWEPEEVLEERNHVSREDFARLSPNDVAYAEENNALLTRYFGDTLAADTICHLPQNEHLAQYFKTRWGAPNFNRYVSPTFTEYQILIARGFIEEENTASRVDDGRFRILPAAFDLLDEIEPSNVFVSYKRSESSALALLVLARLKEIGLSPFVDMAIEPGANWKEFLKEKIESSDFVVVLLGKDTLKSSMTLQEITWAKQAGKVIVPIWHNGFQYKASDWNLMPDLDEVLTNTHTIIVQNESAGGYNNALVELMNRFGYTP